MPVLTPFFALKEAYIDGSSNFFIVSRECDFFDITHGNIFRNEMAASLGKFGPF